MWGCGRGGGQRAGGGGGFVPRVAAEFLPEGIAFDGNRFHRTAATEPFFKYLAPREDAEEGLVSQTFASWNQMTHWLRGLDGLRLVA